MQISKEPEQEIVTKKMRKTQDGFIQHFNKEGKKMISASDVYNQIIKKEPKALTESIHKDLTGDYLMSSTRITYKDFSNAEITHDFGSNVVEPKTYNVKVPVYRGEFKEDNETEAYLQALFDTKNDIDTILRECKKFSKNKTFRLWTPDENERKSNPVRCVRLYFDDFDRFGVGAGGRADSVVGFSRGVIVPSAKQTPTKGRTSK